jgi:uncharacterized membrane protein YgdD (TMEM256/DUF423 family)
MPRPFLHLAALFAATGVALGAFGAHALRQKLDARDLEIFETGLRYQMYHAFALLAVAWLSTRVGAEGAGLVRAAGWAFTAGILVFSGSLYALVLTQTRWLGAITPLGGVAFIAGWVLILLAARHAG